MSKRARRAEPDAPDLLRCVLPPEILAAILALLAVDEEAAEKRDCVALVNLARCDRAFYAHFSPQLPRLAKLDWCLLCQQRSIFAEPGCYVWDGCRLYAQLKHDGRRWRGDGSDGLCRVCCGGAKCCVCWRAQCSACDNSLQCASCKLPVCYDCQLKPIYYYEGWCLCCSSGSQALREERLREMGAA